MHPRRSGRRGFARGLGSRWYQRDNVLERLEQYQRDLEQELADVSDLIRRLRDDAPPQTASPQPTTV